MNNKQILENAPDLYEFKGTSIFTKDGHTMFYEDVAKDLNSMNRTIVQLQERNAELVNRVQILELQLGHSVLEDDIDDIRADAVMEFAKMLREKAKGIPLGAENPSKGASTYNWQIYYADVAENCSDKMRKGKI